ncbi:uncharacterized protein ASPGLDRAFT_73735 [Aspergillus glaucus CBS 516.65]|uniref:Xylanolytic transcriptional activator regulatory domain-containing protein n=1 Tax=Aspergillus glaucus CBS 516.65 TaxID=1160497 RepID=A0A1L9VMA8_ASPGL|nr:hypothetical protein ASPGLDRAFT_73735 [Aspergillus glaucus CBS 516.65]OJJ85014.1 hypothetical protein ASPGLDRAFT_73735 [Aspergillus glaucus CBS 516.65]
MDLIADVGMDLDGQFEGNSMPDLQVLGHPEMTMADIINSGNLSQDIPQSYAELPPAMEVNVDTVQSNIPNNPGLPEDSQLPLMVFDDFDMVNRDITMDLGLTEGDLKFLSLLNTQSTFYENWITTEQLSQGPQLHDVEQAQLMDSDAYHNSPLTNWTPGTDDNAYMDQETHLDSWIHESTMGLNEACPELVMALAAAGAILSPVEAIQKLGYALLEIARLHLNQKLQAYVLILHMGLWSGHKRRIEIAESFGQPIVTMLQRASRFKGEAYSAVRPEEGDHSETLERKWHEWAEAESYKRLVYHMFIHNIQAYVSLSINPLISYVELDLPLPCHRKCWDAKSAAEWKSSYFENIRNTPEPLPSLSRSLQDMSTLSQTRSQLDFALTGFLSVHGIFTILRGLVFQSWQHELQQILEELEMVIVEPLQSHVPELSLIYQAVSLSLYIPLGELEIFAGKDGLERSNDIHDEFIKHISPANLWQAIWHAGQVYHIVKLIPSRAVTGFYATCLYFAALALWMYSTVSTIRSPSQTNRQNDVEEPVLFLLDAEVDAIALRRFILSGHGTPALGTADDPAYLNDQAAVMRCFREVLCSNHPGGTVHGQTRALNNAFSALGSFSGING